MGELLGFNSRERLNSGSASLQRQALASAMARGRVRLGQVGVQLHRPAGSFEREEDPPLRGDVDVAWSYVISVGESCVSQRIVGISGDRLLEQVDAFLDAVRRAAIPKLAAFEVESVSFGIASAGLSEILWGLAGFGGGAGGWRGRG